MGRQNAFGTTLHRPLPFLWGVGGQRYDIGDAGHASGHGIKQYSQRCQPGAEGLEEYHLPAFVAVVGPVNDLNRHMGIGRRLQAPHGGAAPGAIPGGQHTPRYQRHTGSGIGVSRTRGDTVAIIRMKTIHKALRGPGGTKREARTEVDVGAPLGDMRQGQAVGVPQTPYRARCHRTLVVIFAWGDCDHSADTLEVFSGLAIDCPTAPPLCPPTAMVLCPLVRKNASHAA